MVNALFYSKEGNGPLQLIKDTLYSQPPVKAALKAKSKICASLESSVKRTHSVGDDLQNKRYRVEKTEQFPSRLPSPVINKRYLSSLVLVEEQKNLPPADSEKTPLQRRFPPVSLKDTSLIERSGSVGSIHGTTSVFNDNEILKVHKVVSRIQLDTKIFAEFTTHQKAIIQQQATRGCTAAATAMLIIDHQKLVNLTYLKRRNLGDDNQKMRDLREAGLTPLKGKIDFKNTASKLQSLRDMILKNESAIVTVDNGGEHCLVIDDVDPTLSKVRLRDPYHGWEITVAGASLAYKLTTSNIIQVRLEKP